MRAIWRAALAVGLFGLATAASAETLTVGAYPANPPWEVKQEDGSFAGFEIDLVNAIAEKLGVEVEYQDLGFQALFAATASGRIDAAISRSAETKGFSVERLTVELQGRCPTCSAADAR